MEPATIVATPFFLKILEMVLNMGVVGVILMIWYFDKQQVNQTLSQYREDMLEQRKMYENNVELVKQYQGLAGDLKDVIVMNTQAMTKLVERIDKGACK